MSHVRKSKDKAVLRVKLSEGGLLFILNVSKEPSPSDECLFYCIKCIEQSLDNLVGYDINILFETSSVLSERYDNVAKKVCEVCEALTLMNPGLYDQLQEKLHDGLHTRKSVCAAFRNMRKFIFQGSVSWEKIIALFAFTGALVVECILQNNPEHVVIVLYSMKHFAENELTDWISQRNGWTDLFKRFQSLDVTQSSKPKGYIQLVKTCLRESIFERTCDLAYLLQETLLPSKHLMTGKTIEGKLSEPKEMQIR